MDEAKRRLPMRARNPFDGPAPASRYASIMVAGDDLNFCFKQRVAPALHLERILAVCREWFMKKIAEDDEPRQRKLGRGPIGFLAAFLEGR